MIPRHCLYAPLAVAFAAMLVLLGALSAPTAGAQDEAEGTPTVGVLGRLGGAINVMLGQIEQACQARTASEERLRRFVADAAHELRTPLTSLTSYGPR